MAATLAAAQEAEPAPPPAPVVLNAMSFWRQFVTFRPAVDAETAAAASQPDSGSPWTDAPPADWTAIDFDDSTWWRAPADVQDGYGWVRRGGGTQTLAAACLRGKFSVADPAAAGPLTLSLRYRGGVVVYLNGVEIARGHVPAGKADPLALAVEYPWKAYTDEGKTSGVPYTGDLGPFKDNLEARIRTLDNVRAPADRLRKGVNVLAVELHRAPIHPNSRKLQSAWKTDWTTLGLLSVKLTAGPQAGAAIAANTDRPAGLQVWNADAVTAVFDADYGDPNEPLHPVRIVAARNGRFAGQFVVSSDQPIKGLAVKTAAFTSADGKATIAADAVAVFYPEPTGVEGNSYGRYRGIRGVSRYDALAEAAPAEAPVRAKGIEKGYAGPPPRFGAVQPVRVEVQAPADAAAGRYVATLIVSAEGVKPVAVPVELTVVDWALPDRGRFVSHVGIIESPESLALYYKVPLWSEEHWKQVDRAMTLIGRAGGNAIFLPLIAKHHFGKEGMVRWVKKGDGSFGYDWSIFDRYVATSLKHMPHPQVVCLYVWEPTHGASSRYNRNPANKEKNTAPVNVLGPDGQVGEMPSPLYGTEECTAFWKPVLEQARERLLKAGVNEKALMIGMASDSHPAQSEVEAFHAAAPWATWIKQAHGKVTSFYGVPLGHLAFVWGTPGVRAPDDPKGRGLGWRPNRTGTIMTVFPRAGAAPILLRAANLLGEHFAAQEGTLMAGLLGVGRIGADFWDVTGMDRHYGGGTLAGLYANWGQTTISESVLDLLKPGPAGALSTVRLETYFQGVQEAEARIFIEQALTDKARRAKVGEARAAAIQAMLDRRQNAFIAYHEAWQYYPGSGWQRRSRELFDAAAEVARALSAKDE